uniref:Ig-like domain-containing protein n=1 Tax=Salarias fasciatus TaxID=181472 RepID=A0A672J423_SALFA
MASTAVLFDIFRRLYSGLIKNEYLFYSVSFIFLSLINPPCFPPTAPVSDVTIDPETLNLVEFNKSLRLSCNSSGSPLSFLWIKDGSEITASDRVQITDGGRLLSIVNVRRDDQGSYTCKVSNPVSTATSDPATVTVYYGPENIKLTPPAETNHAAGSDITMVCSADSSPPAQFTWYLNGSQLQDTGSELKLVDVNKTQSGSYSCQAFNTETLRFQISEPAVINILGICCGSDISSSLNIMCPYFTLI